MFLLPDCDQGFALVMNGTGRRFLTHPYFGLSESIHRKRTFT